MSYVDEGSPEEKRAVRGLKRLLLAARPIGPDNPPVVEVDSVNTQAKSGTFNALRREDFARPDRVALEIPGSELDPLKLPGDGTIQMHQVMKGLCIPSQAWDMAYLVKDSRKAGLRILIDKDSYKSTARLAIARMLTDPKMPAELGYDAEQYRNLLNRENSIPFKIIENLLPHAAFGPEQIPKYIAAAAAADHMELASLLRDTMRANRKEPLSELKKEGPRSLHDIRRGEDEKCDGKNGGFGSRG